jgi:hypothetical protein
MASDPICAYHASELLAVAPPFRSAHYRYTSITYEGTALTHYAGSWLWANRAPASPTQSRSPLITVSTGQAPYEPCGPAALSLACGGNAAQGASCSVSLEW